MYLAIILLLVKCYFKITDLMVSITLKYGQQIKVNWQQVNINVYVRCFAVIVVQENIWIIFVTLTYLCTDLYFLCEYFFLPLCHKFYFHHQIFSNRDTIIGHVNMYLVKTGRFHAFGKRNRPLSGDLVLA